VNAAPPPIRREILVNADQRTAFEIFTTGIGRWWPLTELAVFGAGASVSFIGKQLVETSSEGDTSVWGTVTDWEEPIVVAFTWHPGKAPSPASHVQVTFSPAGEQTRVTLNHTGWEAFDDPNAARAEYDRGWPMVLLCYHDDANQRRSGQVTETEQTWVVLLHHPGPAAPHDGSLFEDPRFGEHFAFLSRMREAGYLVAAGPLTDETGAGMSVLRLPGTDRLAEATRLATEDDTSVATDFLSVTVRPWRVMLHA
jgi:uncharacterized protein YciI